MGKTLRCGALTLAIFSGAVVSETQAGDCWLLAGDKLEQAREQGLCQDTFARNTKDAGAQRSEVAAVPPAKPSTPPTKRRQDRSAEAKKAHPDAVAPPSWSSPRELEQRTVEAEVVQSGSSAVQTMAPPPADPVADFVSGLRHDFDDFVYDLNRDFSAFRRMIEGAVSPRRGTD